MICTFCGTNCTYRKDTTYECPTCGIIYHQAELELQDLIDIPVPDTVPNPKTESLNQREEDDPMRSIQVTRTNIKFVSIDWLCVRYNKLRKKSLTPDVEREMLLIEEHLKLEGKAELVGIFDSIEQLEMDIPVVMKDQYVPIVEELLKEHRHLKKRKEWLENSIPLLVQPEIPSMTAGYGNITGVTGGGQFGSSIEQSVIRSVERTERKEAELREIESKMHPMEKALQELYPDQLQVIEAKYFPREEPKDEYLINKFTWSRTRYYEVKKAALIRLACSLKII